jgi:hypothetical protein
MKSRTWMLGSILSLMVVLFVATSTVYAAPITVNCSKGGSISGTLASLASAGNTRAITILVTGTCKENITILFFDHLLLQASPVATIQDASNGTAPVVQIYNSYDVRLVNFTVNGGSSGVGCFEYSFCTLLVDRIQQSGGPGVLFGHSNGVLTSNNILNNAGAGILVGNGSKLLTGSNNISNNGSSPGDAGIVVVSGSNLTAQSDTIKSNTNGILALSGSVVRAAGVTINDNTADGVWLEADSTALFDYGNVVTGNGGNGVSINDLSFAGFNFGDSSNNVSGNLTQPDVACNPQYSATRGAGTVGGTTNCMEPQPKK